MKPKRRTPAPVSSGPRPLSASARFVRRAQANATGSVAAFAFMAVVAGGVWWKMESKKTRVIMVRNAETGQMEAVTVPADRPEAEAKKIFDFEAATAKQAEAAKTQAAAEAAAEPGQMTGTTKGPDPENPAIAALKEAEPLLLTGIDAGRDTALKRDAEMLSMTMMSNAYDAYRGLLERSLSAAMPELAGTEGRNRFDPLWAEAPFYKAFLRWQMLDRFSQADIAAISHDSYAREMFKWLMENPSAMEELLLTIRPEDDSAKVLVFLKDAWTANSDKFPKFFNLAVACAVVFDRDVAIAEPLGGESTVNPLSRYLWYIEKDEKGKLTAPVHRSSARDLTWVVCAPVATSELEWAIDKLSGSRKNWGNNYGLIEYLMERAVKGLNPYEEYSFAEIKKEGGICGDQSYFCVNTARAHGIPALILAGETDLGGHAWAAVKTQPDEWDTNVGRIGGVSKGEGGNAQLGGSISEQEIWLWNDRAHQSPVITMSVYRHLWLADLYAALGKINDTLATAKLANELGRSFPETWNRLYEVMEEQQQQDDYSTFADPKIVAVWREFAADMRREFRENPRMAALAARAEDEHVYPYADGNEVARAMKRERRRVERDAGEQKDLIATNLKRQGDLIKKRGEPTAARDIGRLYDTALREYGGSITGFKMMAEDYYNFSKGDTEVSRKAVRDIELAFKRVVETGSKDWFRANTESTIYQMIVGYYREVGDEGRAKLLEKRYQRLLRLAERGAL
ncbi:hypothetical protein OJ996_02775 [Luteolibacter sp. GHJ8]|uniref:Transglutaminase superfamily protein n=1 Tax=Luteolibacter rhizosphaerae TaxID=2989719 RepID=A0ABT3FY30_9BACT|nr:hypothetical protein [Luteolibacter rhizosphaerae]MCW1912480.1 hypothetical protein [Luteolibacter rhizosphaerae]